MRQSRPALFERPVDAIVEWRRPQPACAVRLQLRCSHEFLLSSSSTTRQATMISNSKLPQFVPQFVHQGILFFCSASPKLRYSLYAIAQAGSNWSYSRIGSGHEARGNFFRTLLQRFFQA